MAITEEGIESLSTCNTISTLLPGTTFFLNSKNYANGRKLIDKGCEVALATDFNPGTCTARSLPTMMLLAMYNCGMTLEESFKAITINAAKSIGKTNIGLIKKNYIADIIFWNIKSLEEIPYWFDSYATKINKMMKNGILLNNNIN